MFSTRLEFMGGADGAINKYRRSSHSGEESDRGCSNVRYQVLSTAVLKVLLMQVCVCFLPILAGRTSIIVYSYSYSYN